MADIEIRMLGKFEILMDGKPVLAALKQSRKATMLIQYLVLQNGGIHVAHHAFQPVADAIFGGADLLAQFCQRSGGGIRHGVRCQNGT